MISGTCINTTAQIFSGAAINIFFDLVVFFLPIPFIVRLNISTYKKIGICLTFLCGIFVTVCSIIRLQYLIYWGHTQNPTWDYTSVAIWSSVEANFGMLCACMPPMARPIKKLYKKVADLASSFSMLSEGSTITSGQGHSMTNLQIQAEDKVVIESARDRTTSPSFIDRFNVTERTPSVDSSNGDKVYR
jgi:hypothetical protein